MAFAIMHEPFAKTSGPHDAPIVIIGEAFGQERGQSRYPWVEPPAKELTRMLSEAGLDRSRCLLTNVFPQQPPNNDVGYFCANRKDVGPDYGLPAF